VYYTVAWIEVGGNKISPFSSSPTFFSAPKFPTSVHHVQEGKDKSLHRQSAVDTKAGVSSSNKKTKK
jgi:hypothetical protein